MAVIERVTGTDNERPVYQLKSPATLQAIGSFQACSGATWQPPARARPAQQAWAALPFADRAAHLGKLRNTLLQRMDEVIAAIIRGNRQARAGGGDRDHSRLRRPPVLA